MEVYLTATKASNLKSTEEQVKKAVPQAKVHSYGLDVSSEQQVEDVIGQILKVSLPSCQQLALQQSRASMSMTCDLSPVCGWLHLVCTGASSVQVVDLCMGTGRCLDTSCVRRRQASWTA